MPKPFVLIVEDERDIAALFRHIMDLAGYHTEIAADGTLALERLSSCKPDIILLDLSLPRTPGTRVLQAIRGNERLKNIPVIVITAHYELTMNLGVEPDLVLLKPVSAPQLLTLVERLRQRNPRMETAVLTETPWDLVTGLYARSFLLYRLDSAIRSMKENGQTLFAILAVSPGRYEAIRRAQGSRQADEYLCAVAASLKASVRPTDTLARLEGDHFYILIEQAPGLRIPEMIAARIQSRVGFGSPQALGGSVPCNIGVLLCDRRYTDAGAILRDCQRAGARAEAAGPGTCMTFDHDSIDAGV